MTAIRNTALRAAKWIYRHTPLRPLRRLYFEAFSRLVRHRHVIAQVDSLRYALDLEELIDLVLYLGEYEPDVSEALRRNCFAGAVVLDIGANVGAHTLRLAQLVGNEGRVYAFEPTDYAFTKLTRNLALNPQLTNVVPLRLALSDQTVISGQFEFRATWRPGGDHTSYATTVDFKRLDDWTNESDLPRVDLVKLDVDGHEFEVISGALRLLQRNKPVIVMEVAEYQFENSRRNTLSLLSEAGYSFFDLNDCEFVGIDAIERSCRGVDSINIIARPCQPAATLH
jgi:FkbM family methyltransferase